MMPVDNIDNNEAVGASQGEVLCHPMVGAELELESTKNKQSIPSKKIKRISTGNLNKSRRLSSGEYVVQMGKDTSFRNRIAETISKSIDRSALDDVDVFSHNTGSFASVANSQSNVLQVFLSIGLLLVALVMFFFIVGQDNGGFKSIEDEVISSDSAFVALAVVIVIAPLSCLCVCITNMARRHQQKKNFFCCPNSFDESAIYDPAQEVCSDGDVVSKEDANSFV